MKRENEELRRKMRSLEDELQEVKKRCIGEMDRGVGLAVGEDRTSPRPHAPSPLAPFVLAPICDGGGARASPAKSGSARAPLPSGWGGGWV